MPRTERRRVVTGIGAVLFWLVVWEIASLLLHKPLLLPSPHQTVIRLLALAGKGSFWTSVLLSFGRVLLGALAGIVLGTAAAVFSSLPPPAGELLTPLVTAVRAAPVASFILLVMFFAKTGTVPVIISALMVLPIVWNNVRTGIRETDRSLKEAARLYRLSPLARLRLLYIPQVLPYFTTAAVNSLGFSWKAGIAAEVICLPKSGIGRHLYEAKLYLETADLFAWTLTVILCSVLLEALLKRLVKGKGGKPE